MRDAFQDHRKRPGLRHRDGIAQHRFAPLLLPPLNLITAKLMHRLRCQTDMAHNRHAGADDGANRFLHRDAAFELDRLGAGFLEKAPGVAQRLVLADLIGHERHIADDQSALTPAHHQAGVVDHLVHGDGESIGAALDDTAQGVADQQHLDAGFVENPREGIVVSSQAGYLLASLLHFHYMRYGDLVAHDLPSK